MVKNIPTIERSTKIRFGKHANDNQAENSIVFNASNEAISASIPGAVYMTPLRQASVGGATFVGYDATTKEVVDTNVLTSLLGGISLDEASKQGNVVTNTSPHFAHTVTAFTTRYGSNVGIANTSPIHALDVGENLHITRHGNVITSGKITAGQFYGDGGTLSNIQVGLDDVIVYSNTAASKTVEFNYASGPSLITAGKVGISNANPTHTLDVGSNLYVEDTAADVLNVTGNVNVSNYLKTNKLEVSSLEVDAVTAGTVSSNIIGDNVNVNTITTNVVSLNSISPGDILVGPSSGTVLAKLAAYAPVAGSTVPTSWGTGSNSSSGNTASSSDSSVNAWKVFDGSDTNYYTSVLNLYNGWTPYAYTGSNSLGGINGEWIKIQLASAITPTSVFVKAKPNGTDLSVRPGGWRIMGSNNGTNWTQLHASTTLIDDSSGTTESFSNTTAYLYLAIVVTNISLPGHNDKKWNLSQLLFNYTGSGPTEKFLKSSAAGVSWDEVSSTLQTITDGGATTTQTVAFNNTTTGLTSAGDIDIAASKRIDFATDIIIESTAGTSLNKSPLKIINAIEVDPDVVGGGTSSKNVLAINHTTGEIYDSGGQGGSTMEFIHEEGTGVQANVSIGRTAWGATTDSNLTINTYGSNVLTISGNVSADNITIGALHVSASPFNLDDVASAGAGANVTSNVLQLTATGNAFVTTNNINVSKDVHTGGNVYSQNLQLTNTQISTTWTTGSGTLEIDCKNKTYGTAPAVSIDADVAILNVTNLPSGGQVVVPLVASGADRKVLKTITAGIDFIAFTADVSIDQNSHGLLTVSKIGASGAEKIYMNAISFTAA